MGKVISRFINFLLRRQKFLIVSIFAVLLNLDVSDTPRRYRCTTRLLAGWKGERPLCQSGIDIEIENSAEEHRNAGLIV